MSCKTIEERFENLLIHYFSTSICLLEIESKLLLQQEILEIYITYSIYYYVTKKKSEKWIWSFMCERMYVKITSCVF